MEKEKKEYKELGDDFIGDFHEEDLNADYDHQIAIGTARHREGVELKILRLFKNLDNKTGLVCAGKYLFGMSPETLQKTFKDLRSNIYRHLQGVKIPDEGISMPSILEPLTKVDDRGKLIFLGKHYMQISVNELSKIFGLGEKRFHDLLQKAEEDVRNNCDKESFYSKAVAEYEHEETEFQTELDEMIDTYDEDSFDD